jgi:hypothetical protein
MRSVGQATSNKEEQARQVYCNEVEESVGKGWLEALVIVVNFNKL